MSNDRYTSPLSERYASKEMQYIFSPDKKFKTWRRLWIALAEAENELGLKNEQGGPAVMKEQIEELKSHAEDINYEVAKEREKQVRHDVMSHVYAYGQQCPKAAGIIHLGATSCYVGDNTDVIVMTEGTDYIVTYSNNKKVGTAKFTVTGVNSYKGSSYKGTFTIKQAMMDQNTIDIVVGDKIFKKPGVYKSAPYVSMNGVTLKASEYKTTYYLDDPRTNANARVMDKRNKVTSGDTRVWVKVTGKNKGNFAASRINMNLKI